MPTVKLTAFGVENATAPKEGRIEYWDKIVPGLALRVTSNGAKSWAVMYRLHGKQRRLTIGKYPVYSLSDARGEAREVMSKVKGKVDPYEERQDAIRAAMLAPPLAPDTLKKAAEEYIRLHAKPKNRSWRQTERIFETYIYPNLGNRLLESITRRDIISLMDALVAKKQYALANKIFANLRSFINWCISREKIEASPIAAMKIPAKPVTRDRVLSEEEIKILWQVWDGMGWPFGTAFKLMLLTGQRRSEVAAIRWSQIDATSAIWTLPREQTKADRMNEVPLSSLTIEVMERMPKRQDLLFSTNDRTPISGFSKAKKICDDKTAELTSAAHAEAVKPWRLHDLRRTLSTNMARLRIAEHVVERVINHATGSSSGVAGVYNRHAYTDEKRQALETWANYLRSITENKTENVVALHLSGKPDAR